MITGIMGQSGITSLAREIEYAKRANLYPPCTSRQMTDEEKRRYENMNGSADKTMMNRRGPKPKQIRYCPGCNETLYVKESQLTDNVMVTCHGCGGGYDAAMLGRTPRGGDAMRPESLEGQVPVTINPEFEQAVQVMEAQSQPLPVEPPAADPDDEPIPYEVVKPTPEELDERSPVGISKSLADIIYKFNREYQRGYEAGKAEGFEAGRAEAAKALKQALLQMGA